MVEENEHAAQVDAWFERAGQGLSRERQFLVFRQAFLILWQRAHRTLGDVTLTAIVDRVLFSAAEQYPFLSALKVDATGPQCDALQEKLPQIDSHELAAILRLILVDFLTVLGNLTAEILSSSLHAELSKVALEDSGPHEEEHSKPRNEESNGEDSQP